ncbi:sterigmatocystin 8-O-methyltransferase [Xylaria palmicola]|nr:sterigmatocystin 8-O-methyltransferase [Xylaria palmicola]
MSDPQRLPRFVQLAQTIGAAAAQLQEILLAHEAPFPSFDEDGAFQMPKEAAGAQDALIDAAAELHDLLLSPMDLLALQGGHTNMICFQAITRLRIAAMVPPNGQASYEDIARQTDLAEPVVRRLLQAAATMRVFREPAAGVVAHTRASRLLADPRMNDWLATHAEEGWPAAVKMINALQKWPGSQEPNETGFALANDTSDNLYDVLAANPPRARRFAHFIATNASSRGDDDAADVVEGYDWGSLGPAKVVDVGGSRGHVAARLAARFPALRIVVQDVAGAVAGAEEALPAELRGGGRVRFEAHDFFRPQPATGPGAGADVFLLRLVLHNWSDKYAVRILRALIPALRDGSRVVIVDTCMKEPGALPLWREKLVRRGDMMMGVLLNARERTHGEWRALLTEADPRFTLRGVVEPQESGLAVMDVRWDETEPH